MLKDSVPSRKQSSGTGQDRITGDVAGALESAGVSGEVAKAVAETLKANGHTADARTGEAALSENARVILEKRYLIKGEDGVPIRGP